MKTTTFIISIVFLLYGCVNNIDDFNTPSIQPETPSISIIDAGGKASLKFNTIEDFNKCINLLKEGNAIPLENATRSTDEDFISLRNTLLANHNITLTEEDYNMIMAEGLEYENEDDIIADPNFASILNEDRVLVVDSLVYRYINNGVICGHINQVNNISTLDPATLPGDILENCVTYPISEDIKFVRLEFGFIKEVDGDTVAPTPNHKYRIGNTVMIDSDDIKFISYNHENSEANEFQKWISGIFGTNVVVNNNFDDTHRMRVRLFSQDYLIYSSVGMTVRFQKKVLGCWWRANADEFVYGWQNIELQTEYTESFIPQVTIRDTNPPVTKYPDAIRGQFPYTSKDLLLFYINSNIYDTVSKDIVSVYIKHINSIRSLVNDVFNRFPAFADTEPGIYVPYNNSRKVLYLIPPGQEHAENKGRDIVEWDFQWFSGFVTFALAYNFNSNNWEFSNISATNAYNQTITRGEVYAYVRYNNQIKACVITSNEI